MASRSRVIRPSLGAETIRHGGARAQARIEGALEVDIGDRLVFSLPTDRLHLFDPASGRRLEGIGGCRLQRGGGWCGTDGVRACGRSFTFP